MTTPITGQGLNVCIPPDDELSSTSKKAAQNKVITEEFTELSNAISQKAPIIINTASGDIASFADGADGMQIKKLVGTIEPVQDLHGYDAPWPAGGGKNKIPDGNDTSKGYLAGGHLNPDGTTTGANGWYVSEYFNVTPGESYTWSSVNNSAIGAASICFYDENKTYISGEKANGELPKTLVVPQNAVYCRASQSTIANNICQLEVGTTATTPILPYSNECPISGWTGCEIGRCVNLLNGITALDWRQGYAIVASSGQITMYTALGVACADYIDVSNHLGKQVYLNHRPTGFSGGFAFYSGKDVSTYVSGIGNNGVTTQGEWIITIPDNPNIKYMRFTANPNYLDKVILCLVETKTTIPINWQSEAGTIYGGTVMLYEDGSADVTAEFVKRTISSISGSFGATNKGYAYYTTLAGTNHTVPYAKQGNMRSNLFSYYPSSRADAPLYSYGGKDGADTTLFFILPSTITTVADANAWFSSNPTDITVYLATPQTYHFDNIGQLYTYLGTNNVWIDTGAITECDYPADTKLYIDGLTAPDEDMIANANIASGKYFVVNNQLYLSTAAIAAGASIVPGTNCTATNIAEALNTINT